MKWLFATRLWVLQLPGYVYYRLLWWLYPTTILRFKAALCPYPLVRDLMLRCSGVRLARGATTNVGMTVIGRSKSPPAVELGDRVAIGPHVTFVTSSHPEASRLLGHPDARHIIRPNSPIRVEQDAWIGAGAILLPGVTVGRFAVVGAGAVVTEDVAAYTVVAGVPARVIRRLSKGWDASDED